MKDLKKSREKLLIIFLNIIAIAANLIDVYKSNVDFFSENIYTITFFTYLSIIIISILIIENNKVLLAISILLFLDIPFFVKSIIQNFLITSAFSSSIFLIHIITFLILVVFIFVLFLFLIYNSKFLIIFLLFYYSIAMLRNITNDNYIIKKDVSINFEIKYISKNYYFLLFDEYPNQDILTKYSKIKKTDLLSSILNSEGFINIHNIRSNYVNTENSITALLTGVIENNYNINQTINSLTKNAFSNRKNYQFNCISIFDENNRKNSLVSIEFFHGINSLLTRYILPFILKYFSERGNGVFTDYEDYHRINFSKLENILDKKEKNITFIHFYTPHYYPLIENISFEKRILNANQWIKKSINIIQKNDSNAGIVIFSDHGLRLNKIPKNDWTKNILYYKNINIDTIKLNKFGLTALFNSITF